MGVQVPDLHHLECSSEAIAISLGGACIPQIKRGMWNVAAHGALGPHDKQHNTRQSWTHSMLFLTEKLL